MPFFFHILTLGCLHLFSVLGLNLVFGKGKILHFGVGAVSISAAYPLWVLVTQFHTPFIFAAIITLISTMALSFLLMWLSLRLPMDAFGVMTIALHLMFLSIVLNWQSVTRGALGIPQIPRGILPEEPMMYAIVVLILAILWICFILIVDRSRIGRALRALAEHPWYGESLGIQRWHITFIAFLIMGLGTLIGDILFAPFLHLLSPTDFGFQVTIFFVMIIVAGKPGSVFGCIAATLLLTFLKEGLRFLALPADVLGPVRLMLFGVILFAAVWARRDTLFPHERSI